MTIDAAGLPPLPTELLDMCVTLAAGAGELVRDARHAGMTVETKSTATDLVTEVDTECERWLTGQILARRPDDAILGEEGAGHSGRSGVRWLIDPIDGTVNFVLGLPQYAVSVAAEVDGVVVAGAVTNPVSGEIYRASLGGGAFRGDQRLTGPRDVPLERAVVATGFGYDVTLR
ncbi:MAG TPA: inositol monophosphatase family protein, partial [Jatrophihabitans sp.]|nr:inositol monophosphatase family protein [Jatrophihabitans sp.]